MRPIANLNRHNTDKTQWIKPIMVKYCAGHTFFCRIMRNVGYAFHDTNAKRLAAVGTSHRREKAITITRMEKGRIRCFMVEPAFWREAITKR